MESSADASRHQAARWRWWQKLSGLLGLAVLAGALAPPLDGAGRDGSLVAHFAQHLLLGDVAPLLLMLGLPPRVRGALARGLGGLPEARGRGARLLATLFSPVGALILWVLATYIWFVPAVHRAAVGDGVPHVIEHVSFLAFGLLLALAVFDPRPASGLRQALRRGGLPWWGRHAYSMGSRLFMVPPALAVLFASSFSVAASPAGDASADTDRANAASLLLGFEMTLFALSFVLAFLFLAVSEGKRREPSVPADT